MLAWKVVHSYPHDPGAFTQGLLYAGGALYESTGLVGRSSVRRVALRSGRVLARRELPSPYFGEGLALRGGTLVQLTWKARVAFLYARATLAPEGTLHYATQGWGLTSDGRRFIMSDGSDTLYFRDARDFAVTARVHVHDGNRPVWRLNELEWIDGAVYANVWQSARIARIDPASGRVTGWIDLWPLLGPGYGDTRKGVLNGIAWDAAGRRLFVTGKLWPRLFQIEVEGLPAPRQPRTKRWLSRVPG